MGRKAEIKQDSLEVDLYESLREVMIWFWANVDPTKMDKDAQEMAKDAELVLERAEDKYYRNTA